MGHPLFDGAFQKEALSNRQKAVSNQSSHHSAVSNQQNKNGAGNAANR
jgi:hypothetical protein